MFVLNCSGGNVVLRENFGFMLRDIDRIEHALTASTPSFAALGRAFMADRKAHDEATARAADLRAAGPVAIAARYDRRIGRIVIQLSSGLEVSVRPRDLEGFEHARPSNLDSIEITPSGLGLHFPELDADLYLPSLLEGVFGTLRFDRPATADAP